MGSGVADFLHAEDREGMAVYFGGSDVSILTAHLGKEYSLVRNDEYLVVLLVDFEDLCITAVLLKAEKFSDGIRLYVECADDGLGIYFFFQSADLLCAEGLGIKVKSKAFRRDAGTLLGGVSGDDLVECPVQQVGRRMVRFDRGSALPVERDVQRAAHLEA